MAHPCAARQRNSSLKLVLLLKFGFWLSQEVPKLKVVSTVKMGAVGIPEVGLAGITKTLSIETLRAWESLICGARYGHDLV